MKFTAHRRYLESKKRFWPDQEYQQRRLTESSQEIKPVDKVSQVIIKKGFLHIQRQKNNSTKGL